VPTLNAGEASRAATAAAKKRTKIYKPDTVRAAFSPWFVGDGLPDDEGNIRAFCPICEDPATSKSPSAMFKPETGIWNCLKGNHGGSIVRLAADLKKERGWDIRSEAMRGRHQNKEFKEAAVERLSAATGKDPSGKVVANPDEILALSERLLDNKAALSTLSQARGFTRETIVAWHIGFDGSRYTIPVRNARDEIINVRRYKLNAAAAADKMLNTPGHGAAAVFGLSILAKNETVVLTEGEPDCILLNQVGIPAVTHTAGASTFRPQWGPLFADKHVYICYDNDKAGKDGARKVKKILDMYAASVTIVEIPLDFKGADVTDYIHKEGYTAEDFRQLMEDAASREQVEITRPIPESGKRVSLTESMSEENQNEVLQLEVSVAGRQQEPYTAPKVIEATCDMSKGAACNTCPVSAKNGSRTVEIRADNEALFRFVDSTEDRRKKLLRELVGARCSDRVEFDVPEDYHIEEILVQPSIDDRRDNESQTPQKRTLFSVGSHNSPVNEKRRVVGRNTVDPKTGKLRFMIWKSEQVELDIDNFQMSEDEADELEELFSPEPGQSSLEKCLEIAEDMAQNVTHIYGRGILHVAYDLVWHSVLAFNVNGLNVEKGWLEMLVIGDTRTGKSEIAKSLINHYNSGQLLSCEGMSFPGIVGGVQQIDNRWHMTWGAVPMNDRRLVVLDEVSGLKEKNIIEQMSSIRSSGIAQITKIQSEETSARTRLIWIGNPADGSSLADNPDLGIHAMRTLVPANEDIARFDFVTAAQKGEVADDIINSGFNEALDPKYSGEACERLIKWVWSLGRDQIWVSKEAASAAIAAASDLGSRYVSDPPLIQSENVRYKVLRIAAALAARTFSRDKRGRLAVKSEHVKSAVAFLDMVYSQESIGYARKSRRAILAKARALERRNATKAMLKMNEESILHTLRSVGGRTFRQADFKMMGGMSDEEALAAVQKLLSWSMVQIKSRGDISMDAQLVSILREIEDEEDDLL
jgi:hypothetical protein